MPSDAQEKLGREKNDMDQLSHKNAYRCHIGFCHPDVT